MNEAMIFAVTIEREKWICEQNQMDTCKFETLEVNFSVFFFLEKESSTLDNGGIFSLVRLITRQSVQCKYSHRE